MGEVCLVGGGGLGEDLGCWENDLVVLCLVVGVVFPNGVAYFFLFSFFGACFLKAAVSF